MKPSEKEKMRLNVLKSYGIIDTPPEYSFDKIVALASIICNTPMALITFLDDKRQWFKARKGIEIQETPKELSFCQYTIQQNGIYEVQDAKSHPLFKSNPYVDGREMKIRFYAGVPLQGTNQQNLGTLCVIDESPTSLTDTQREALMLLADQIMSLLEMRKSIMQLTSEVQRLAEDKLKSIELELNTYKDALDKTAIVSILNIKGTLQYVNEPFCATSGYQRHELIGRHPRMLNSGHHPDQFFDELWAQLRNGIIWEGELLNQKKDGSQYWVKSTIVPFFNASGVAHKFMAIEMDITDQKSIGEELRKAKLTAEQALKIKENFLANMSHEIRTPLNAIIGFTDLLMATNLDTRQRDYVDTVRIAGDNLLHIINDILDLSKIESGKVSIQMATFNLEEKLRELIKVMQVKADEKQLLLTLNYDPKAPKLIDSDWPKLNQILINLLANAIKFTQQGSVTLSVSCKEKNNNRCMILFDVSDTGKGIPAHKISTILERFEQEDENILKEYGGSGLGLNIAKALIELLGSTLQIKSEPGKGSSFYFYTWASQAIHQTLDLTKPMQEEQFDFPEMTILLVEDNVLNQKLIINLIERIKGRVVVANDGQEALQRMHDHLYDIILMDLQMPVLDGYQTAEIIRQTNKFTPIVALTAYSNNDEREKCLSVGMNDYMTKPFKSNDFYVMLKRNITIDPTEILNETLGQIPKNSLVDLSFLYEHSFGNKEFEKNILELFLHEMPNEVSKLKSAAAQQELQQVREIAHKMKSTVSFIGANDLREILQQIENQAKSSNFNQDEVNRNLKYITEKLDEIYPELEQILSKNYKML
jgi:PAS domain S-box-containing protein